MIWLFLAVTVLTWQVPELPMPDQLGPFTVYRSNDAGLSDPWVDITAQGTPSSLISSARSWSDTSSNSNPSLSPTRTWHYKLGQTTQGGLVVPYNTGYVTSNKPGDLQWLKTVITDQGAYITGLAVDPSGNVVAVGYFYGTMDLGTGPISSAGNGDIFITKYSSQGSILWVKRLGGAGDDMAQAVVVDSHGNIIVTGSFTRTVDFGGGAMATAGLVTPNIFVAKYSPSGMHIWSKRFGGTGGDGGNAVAVDSDDNVILAAALWSDNADFGSVILSSHGNSDIALAKLSAGTGETLWAVNYGGFNIDQANAIAVDSSQNIVVTGSIRGASDIGGGPVASTGPTAMFLANYSGSNGTYRWGKIVNSTGGSRGSGVAIDPRTGNIVVTGGFVGIPDFGGVQDPWAIGGLFMAGYDASGNYLWDMEGAGKDDSGTAVTIDRSGNLGLTGTVLYGLWGSTGNGGNNYFVATFTIAGNAAPDLRWLNRPNTGNGHGQGIAFDPLGHVLTAGYFAGTVDFGGASASSAYNAGFIAQYAK